MASYLDDLAAQVKEKRQAQESEKLRDRAANLQHMGAAPFAGGPGPANGFLADQGARVERAQAELDYVSRPRGGAQQHGTLQAAQPLDQGKMNLFGAPRALPAALQAGPVGPPMRDAQGDAKSKRDEMWERKRQQRMQRQNGLAPAPGGGGDGGAAEAKTRRDEIYEQKRRQFLERQPQPEEAQTGLSGVLRGGRGERPPPAATEAGDERDERRAMQQQQQQHYHY